MGLYRAVQSWDYRQQYNYDNIDSNITMGLQIDIKSGDYIELYNNGNIENYIFIGYRGI